MRLEDHHIPVVVDAHPVELAQIGLWHLPRDQKFSLRRKFLYSAGHIDHIKIVAPVHSNGSWLMEFARSGSAMPNNFDAPKQPALLGRFVAATQQQHRR